MAKNSSIEWTHHTFNPWWGCTKISPACDHCYAETWARRTGNDVWGKHAERRFFGESHWRDPVKWNLEASSDRVRRRVFCASMADVFEKRADLQPHRVRLWKLIEDTPWLDWLILTKRPQSAVQLVPWRDAWPNNVWLGTTVENEQCARLRIPHLLGAKAAIRFVSCEPLLGPIELGKYLGRGMDQLNWVIAGGESGGNSRPADEVWIRSLRDQCVSARVPFHFKQWGNWRPTLKGGSKRHLPVTNGFVERVSKKSAGRLLDGRTWDEFPKVKV